MTGVLSVRISVKSCGGNLIYQIVNKTIRCVADLAGSKTGSSDYKYMMLNRSGGDYEDKQGS